MIHSCVTVVNHLLQLRAAFTLSLASGRSREKNGKSETEKQGKEQFRHLIKKNLRKSVSACLNSPLFGIGIGKAEVAVYPVDAKSISSEAGLAS